MKAAQLKQILQLYSELVHEAHPNTAAKLLSVAEELGKLGAQTLKKITSSKAIDKAKESLQKDDFRTDGVSQALRKLAILLTSASAKSSIEINELARVIENELWDSSDAFIAAISTTKSVPREIPPIRLDMVRTYSDELAKSEGDNDAFDQLIARITSDRAVRKQEMQEIASRFFGYRAKPATKAKLLEKIVDLQAKTARQEARSGSQT